MKTRKTYVQRYKEVITRRLIELIHKGGNTSDTLSKIYEMVQWAWDNWDEDIISTYYEGEKPISPTKEFIEQWVDNEDFEADGFDWYTLKGIFGSY